MTDQQKEQIAILRSQGYGYKRIAQIMELSDNTVKSFCKRNNRGIAFISLWCLGAQRKGMVISMKRFFKNSDFKPDSEYPRWPM